MVSKVKTKNAGIITKLFMITVLIACMLFSSVSTASAAETNPEVTNVKNSIVQVRLMYNHKGTKDPIQSGTGFLINNNTVVTCYHVVHVLDDDYLDEIKSNYGSDYNVNNFFYDIVVQGDVSINLTVKKESEECDFSILTLQEPIYSKTPVKLAVSTDGSDLGAQGDMVYALGFPKTVSERQDKNTYTSSDVTFTSGTLSKFITMDTVDYIQHSAEMTDGNSGGPLVNGDGAVIAINRGEAIDAREYKYSVRIDQLTTVLDALGIEYTAENYPNGSSTAAVSSTAESENETSSQEEAAEVSEPVPEASSVVSETAPADDPASSESEDEGVNVKLIIIIAIVVLVVILIVVVVLIMTSGKKEDNTATIPPANPPMNPSQPQPPQMGGPTPPQGFAPPQPPQFQNRPPMTMGASPTIVSNEGAGETSVLNSGEGETTVLGNQSTGFFLVRKSSGERININKPEFIIGKERRRVDYCISDNGSVSRTHAKFRIRADRCYVSDLGSTNCTFVNGSKISPNQEVVLSKGDEISISDEKFEFIG